MATPAIKGKIASVKQWTDSLFSLRAEADLPPFEAGQFIRLGLPIDGKEHLRSYSFVNGPAARPYEFYFIKVEGGPLTERLPRLRAGDEILFAPRPAGYLVLSEVPQAEQLWMLATGTAIGPFLSILQDEAVWRRFPEIVLAHAVRRAEELSYAERIRALVERGGGRLRFAPFVSREETPGAFTGRIPAALASGSLSEWTGLPLSPEKSQFMVCGNPKMVADTSDTLKEMGFARNRRRTPGHITVENYW